MINDFAIEKLQNKREQNQRELKTDSKRTTCKKINDKFALHGKSEVAFSFCFFRPLVNSEWEANFHIQHHKICREKSEKTHANANIYRKKVKCLYVKVNDKVMCIDSFICGLWWSDSDIELHDLRAWKRKNSCKIFAFQNARLFMAIQKRPTCTSQALLLRSVAWKNSKNE